MNDKKQCHDETGIALSGNNNNAKAENNVLIAIYF